VHSCIDDSKEFKTRELGQGSRRQYLGELKKVVEAADVILHVLDARDPTGTKSNAIEEMVALFVVYYTL
jgi:nuclear GTP-binding protein